jgi:Type I phosphodiesterase / nucleotide pyrophosphatase
MQRLIGPALAALIVIGASLARDVRDRIWAAYIAYGSTVARQLPIGEAPPQRTRRVVVLIVRGLRADESQLMPTLNALRARGAEVTLELSAPTYRIPVWLTLFSGARPAVHGTLTDASARNSDIDTIFARLGAAGRASVIIGSADWNDLYGAQVQRIEVIEADAAAQRDSLAMDALLQTLKDPAAPEQLIVAELGLPEEAARRAPETYAAALAATDIRLQQISSAMDLANATLIVTSDRGLTAGGGAGGSEATVARVPMAMAGAGIRRGTQAIARGEDLAPSLAQLLGVPIPVHAQGTPVWDAIDAQAYLASARQLTGFYEGWSEATVQPRFAAELLRTYEADIGAGQRARYDTWNIALNAAARAAEQTFAGDGRGQRLPVAAIGLLLVLACALIMLNNSLAPPLVGAALYTAGWLFDVNVLRASAPSLSLFDDVDPSAYYAWLARDHQILIGMACAATALLAARLCDDSLEAIIAVISTVGLVMLACVAQALWYFWQWGDAFAVTPPSPDTLAAALAALTQAAANDIVVSSALPAIPLVLAAPILAVIAWAALGGAGRRAEE